MSVKDLLLLGMKAKLLEGKIQKKLDLNKVGIITDIDKEDQAKKQPSKLTTCQLRQQLPIHFPTKLNHSEDSAYWM